jgi:hypothetical protein
VKQAARTPLTSPGLTFTIALWILGLVAALQVLGAAWVVIPATIVRVATASPSAEEEPAPPPALTTPAESFAAPVTEPAEVSPARMQEAMAFVSQAESAYRVGDWEGVLSAVNSAEAILGNNAELQVQRAFALARLGRERESADILARALSRPDLDPQTRQEAEQLYSWIQQTIENMEASGIPTARPVESGLPAPTENAFGGPMLEDIGLQPGAALGIVEAREILGDDEKKTLRIAIKSRPNVEIDSSDVKVSVRFFERGPEEEIVLTTSPVTSEWISPPVDWADNEPEILDVVYPLPSSVGSPNEFHGYTVAIYFRDELQDTRAVPGGLDQLFPPELFLESLP